MELSSSNSKIGIREFRTTILEKRLILSSNRHFRFIQREILELLQRYRIFKQIINLCVGKIVGGIHESCSILSDTVVFSKNQQQTIDDVTVLDHNES